MFTGYLRTIYEETMGKVPLKPLLGKQNIQAKEVYSGYKIPKICDGKNNILAQAHLWRESTQIEYSSQKMAQQV